MVLTTVCELKKKWANLRECYRRDLHRQKLQPKGSCAKRYTYAEILSFLSPVFKNKCPEENGSDENMENIEDRKRRDAVMMRRRLARKHGYHNFGITRPYKVETKREEKEDDEFEDDTKFLLSLRSYMRGISDSHKLQLKIEMLQLVQKFRKQGEAPQSSSVLEWSSYPYPNAPGPNIAFHGSNVTHNNGVVTNSRVVPSNAFLPTLIIQSPMPATATNSNSSLMAVENRNACENITQIQSDSDPDLEIVKSEI